MIGEYPCQSLRTDEIRCAGCGCTTPEPIVVRVADHMERGRNEGTGMRCAVCGRACREHVQARAKFGARVADCITQMECITKGGRFRPWWW